MKHVQTIVLFGIFIAMVLSFAGSSVIVKADDSEVVNMYNNVKQEYRETLSEYKSIRSNFLSMRNKYRGESSTISSEQIFDQAKISIQKTSTVMARYLESVKIKFEMVKGMNEEYKNRIIEEINSDITALQEEDIIIDNSTENTELFSVASSIRERWAHIKVRANKYIGILLVARTRQTINKLEQASIKVEEYVAQLEESSQGVGNLNNLLEEINQKLETTKTQVTSAEEIFNTINSSENAKSKYRQGRDFLISANKYIRESWQIFRSSVSELKKRSVYSLKTEQE